MAILALMLARYPSMERFIHWYRQQIERIEAGELSAPARLRYEDDQLDLPRQPGPDAVSVEELRWRTTSVHLDLTIWRPYEFSQRRYAERIQHALPGTKEWKLALAARSSFRFQAKQRIHADPHAYFVEVHPAEAMPWFMGPVADWYGRLGRAQQRQHAGGASNAGSGTVHAGVGTPAEWLVSYLQRFVVADRQAERRNSP